MTCYQQPSKCCSENNNCRNTLKLNSFEGFDTFTVASRSVFVNIYV